MAEISKGKPVKKISVPALIVTIILVIALVGTIVANVYASGQTSIFTMVEYGATLQNSQVFVDEEKNLTFLGTYANSVIAVDGEGKTLWTQPTGGATGALAYDADKSWLIVGSQDRNVYVYEAETGNLVNTYPVNGKVYDLDYDVASGQLLVSAGVSASKHTLYILNINTGEEILKLALKNTVRAAKFSEDMQYIYYGDKRGRVNKLDMTGEKIAETRVKTEVYGLQVTDGNDVIVYDEDGNLYRMDADFNEKFRVTLVGDARALGVSADGRWIAAGTREGDAYILDSNGNVQYATRMAYDVSQVYVGESRSYVVTLSDELFAFSTQKLDNIGTMSNVADITLIAAIVLAVLALAALIVTFASSRRVAARFFGAIRKHRVAYLMLLPSLVLILIFNYYNVFQAFFYAFTDWSLATKTMREVKFVGFDNFIKMITEGYFLLGVKNLVIMMLCSFLKLLTVPILLAELVFAMRNRHGESSKRRYWFRLFLVVPMVVPGVVSTLMWKNIYDPNIGALNSFLTAIGRSDMTHSWLGDGNTALWSIIFMGFPWVNSFAFLVFYGGLINIPTDLFEAAKVDGSNPIWNFWHIHIPLITPQLKMMIITTFIGAVQDYGGIYLLTGGGPGTSTYVPGLELYYAATKFGQYGYACAMGIVMFIVILIGSMLNLRMKTQEA